MDNETISLLVWCKYDSPSNPSGALIIRVVRADTGEEVLLKDGSYLLRISPNDKSRTIQCLVRHLESEREVYFQSGKRLPDFVKACLVREDESLLEVPEKAREIPGESDDEDGTQV